MTCADGGEKIGPAQARLQAGPLRHGGGSGPACEAGSAGTKKNIGVSRPSKFTRRIGRGRLEMEGAHAHPSLAAGLGVGV